MAEKIVPLSVQERHKLLFIENTPAQELAEWGRAHADKGLLHDALEYFDKAGDKEMIAGLRRRAIDEADLVLYLSVLRTLRAEPETEELFRLRDSAEKFGKGSVAEAVSSLVASRENRQK